MKNTKYYTVGTNLKIVDRVKMDNLNTKIYDRSLSWLSTGTSIKSGRKANLPSSSDYTPLSEYMKALASTFFSHFSFFHL